MSDTRFQIFQTLLAMCPPAPALPGWPMMRSDPDVRLLDVEPDEAIDHLREQFSDVQLRDSKVVVGDREHLAVNREQQGRCAFAFLSTAFANLFLGAAAPTLLPAPDTS